MGVAAVVFAAAGVHDSRVSMWAAIVGAIIGVVGLGNHRRVVAVVGVVAVGCSRCWWSRSASRYLPAYRGIHTCIYRCTLASTGIGLHLSV